MYKGAHMAEYQGKRFKKPEDGKTSGRTRTTRSHAAPTRAHAKRPKREKRRRRVLPLVLIGVGVVLLIAAGVIFVHAMVGYQQAVNTYESLAELAPVSDDATDDEGADMPTVDFDALQAINPDIVGWIYIPGTSISYPVVQGDDNEEYLNRLADGTANSSGSIFLDAVDTAPGMVDQQTTLYGHHMNNRTMFYEIDETTDQATFDQIEVAYYLTPEATYRCSPLMTSVVQSDYRDARTPSFEGDEAFTAYLRDLRANAQAVADDVDTRLVQATKVLSLITCSGEIPTADRTVMTLSVDEELPASDAA